MDLKISKDVSPIEENVVEKVENGGKIVEELLKNVVDVTPDSLEATDSTSSVPVSAENAGSEKNTPASDESRLLSLHDLPTDALSVIFQKMDPSEHVSLRLTCKDLNQVYLENQAILRLKRTPVEVTWLYLESTEGDLKIVWSDQLEKRSYAMLSLSAVFQVVQFCEKLILHINNLPITFAYGKSCDKVQGFLKETAIPTVALKCLTQLMYRGGFMDIFHPDSKFHLTLSANDFVDKVFYKPDGSVFNAEYMRRLKKVTSENEKKGAVEKLLDDLDLPECHFSTDHPIDLQKYVQEWELGKRNIVQWKLFSSAKPISTKLFSRGDEVLMWEFGRDRNSHYYSQLRLVS